MSTLPEALLTSGAPGRFDLRDGVLFVDTGTCTCDGPFPTGYPEHRPLCGLEPVMAEQGLRELPSEELAKLLRTAGAPTAPEQEQESPEDRMLQALLYCGELYEPQDGDGLVHAQELDHLLDRFTAAELDRLAVMAQLLRYEIQLRQRQATWSAAESVLAERGRQAAKGYTAEHDDQWVHGELLAAAGCYLWAARGVDQLVMPIDWPQGWAWKPSPNPVRNLIKAAGLAAAEADRLHRLQKAQVLREQTERVTDHG
jgi:hypothetical protein